jgi:Uma2 family endonuclease
MLATLDSVSQAVRAAVTIRYPVEPRLREWELPGGTVPESAVHDAATERLVLLLKAWVAELKEEAQVARNLAVRWLEKAPQVGIDPDVCVLCPPPPERGLVESLRLWVPGHFAPPLCFEIVSRSHPYKDYAEVHERYAAMGTRELVVFDPLLAGPKSLGGPVSLQVWRRDALGTLDRVYFGAGPAHSEVLNAWLVPEGNLLAIAGEHSGERRWQTIEERERAEKERERAVRMDLERRVAELERQRR